MENSELAGTAGATVGAAVAKSAAGRELLTKISADDYDVWFRVGCALKHLGEPYGTFRDWSATSSKFDEDECRQKWDDLPDEPRAGMTTLRELAGVGVTFVEPPSDMRPAPEDDEARIRQGAEYISALFRAGDCVEFCGARLIKERWIPDRGIRGLEIEETDTADQW